MKKMMVFAGIVVVLGLVFAGCSSGNDRPLTGTVIITGDPWIGHTLAADTENLDGDGDIFFQWQRSDSWGGWTNIGGATNGTYVVESGDFNRNIRVRVSRVGYSGSVDSASRAVTNAPTLTGTVSITGIAQVGQILTANTGNLGGSGTISFQWQRSAAGGGGWANISGATDSTYVVQSDDSDRRIRVDVTRANNSGIVTSQQTAIVIERERDFVIEFGIGINQITVPNVSIAVGPGTVTVSNPEQFSQIRWYRGATLLSGSGNRNQTLSLNSAVHGNRVGTHRVTVEVIRSGVPQSMVIEFTVVP